MAIFGCIEAREGEDWNSVSELFGGWIQRNEAARDYGWSEDDNVHLPDGRMLFAFAIPNQHDPSLFTTWADGTGRLYGLAERRAIHFPREPNLSFELPPFPDVPLPEWLR